MDAEASTSIEWHGVEGLRPLSPTHQTIGHGLMRYEMFTMDYPLEVLSARLRWSKRKVRAVQTGCYHLTLCDLLSLSAVFNAPLESVITGRY